jgi:hypothetical protein
MKFLKSTWRYYIMARGKSTSAKAFEKVLTVLLSGNPVTKEELNATLGSEIQMYRLSTYIWDIKTHANGIVRVIKDGRKVSAYQLVNVDEMKAYMKRTGATAKVATPAKASKPKVSKLKDLQAQPAVEVAPVVTDTVVEITDNETAV